MDKNKYCIIMAGGGGTRFWPLGRNAMPKQFLDILGIGQSFLQMTVKRFSKIIPIENIIVVSSRMYSELVKEQLPQIPEENILLEPYKRNTAPCIAYATYKLYAKNPDAVVVVSPSDHLIVNDDDFEKTISDILEYATDNDNLFTIGVRPTSPNTNYGYIQIDKSKAVNVNGADICKIKTFTEKPNTDLAQVFFETGEFYWNSGMFIWNIRTIKEEIEEHLPEVATLFEAGKGIYGSTDELDFIQHVYENSPSISIDYGVMEKTSNTWVYPASFGWSDVGTWNSLYDITQKKDNAGNAIAADNLLVSDSKDCIFVEKEKKKLVVVKNLDRYIVVDTNDVLMVCPRNDAAIKEILVDLAVEDKAKYL